MPAPARNKNAEKWTRRDTLAKLIQLKQYADLAHINTLGTALSKVDLYDGIWTYWKRRWADDEEIMHRMCCVDQIFISKVVEGALNKRLHAGMAMFILRAKHGMRDKPLQKNEREPEEKLEPHLQAELDRAEAARHTEAPRPNETPITPPAKPATIPNHRTIGRLACTPYNQIEATLSHIEPGKHAETALQQGENGERRAAA